MGNYDFLNLLVNMIPRIVNLTESSLLKYFKKKKGDWTCFMGIVLLYFPQIVVCVLAD